MWVYVVLAYNICILLVSDIVYIEVTRRTHDTQAREYIEIRFLGPLPPLVAPGYTLTRPRPLRPSPLGRLGLISSCRSVGVRSPSRAPSPGLRPAPHPHPPPPTGGTLPTSQERPRNNDPRPSPLARGETTTQIFTLTGLERPPTTNHLHPLSTVAQER